MTVRLHWEDPGPGPVRALGAASLPAQERREFAARFDPQPFHRDEQAGRDPVFGALCASGWHTDRARPASR